MKRVIASPRAELDFEHLIDWLADRSPSAAERLAGRYFAAVRMLSEHPFLGRSVGGGERELAVKFGRHGIVLRYSVDESVVIVRVFHGAQDRA